MDVVVVAAKVDVEAEEASSFPRSSPRFSPVALTETTEDGTGRLVILSQMLGTVVTKTTFWVNAR
jgi:hypothetical protein